MKKTIKKVLAAVLAATMIIGSMAVAAFAADTYNVAGAEGLCGVDWDPAQNQMKDNGDGTYSCTFTGVKAGTYEFKIATNGAWDNGEYNLEGDASSGGSNAKVTVVEAVAKPDILDENEYCDIVASKDGIITKINVTNGTALVKEGDVVENGRKLIGGWMEGKYTGVRYMHASGDIEAKVWYIQEKTESLIQQEKVKTNAEENKYAVTLNKNTINFYKTISKFEKYDTMETKNKIKILNNFYLPIEFKKITNYEYRYEQKQYTVEQLQEKIIQELEEQMKNDIKNKQIVNRNIIAEPTETELKVKLIYEVIEKIGVEQKLVS